MENNIKVGDKVTVVALDITEPGIPETEIFQIGELLEISTFDKTIKNNPDAFISIDDMDDENITTYNVDGEWYYQDMDILIRHFKEGDVETKNNEFTKEMKNWTSEELINNLRGVVNKSTNWELWIKNRGEEMIEEVISRSIDVEDWMGFQGEENIEKPENDNISKTFDQDFDYTIKEQKLYTSINEFKRYLNK